MPNVVQFKRRVPRQRDFGDAWLDLQFTAMYFAAVVMNGVITPQAQALAQLYLQFDKPVRRHENGRAVEEESAS